MQQVDELFRERFDDNLLKSPFYNDYVTIGEYLSDPNLYGQHLAALETAMDVDFTNRVRLMIGKDRDTPDILRSKAYYIKEYLDGSLNATVSKLLFSKLLTKQLAEFETGAHFQLGSNDKADIVLGGVKKKFNDELAAQRPLKDVGAGAGHGEFSHRMQWYLVGKSGRLKYPVVSLYKDIPGHRSPENTQVPTYLWIVLFDRDGEDGNAAVITYKGTDIFDFRAPSNLNGYLRGNLNINYPLLQLVFSKRYEKRKYQNIIEYYARKTGKDAKSLFDSPEYFDWLAKLDKRGIVLQRTDQGVNIIGP